MIILHTTTNQKQLDAVGEKKERRRDHQGACGACLLEKGDNTVAAVVARCLSIAPGTYLSSEDVLVATNNLQVKCRIHFQLVTI